MSPQRFKQPENQVSRDARELALKRLAIREHSCRELEMYLRRHDVPIEVVAATLATLTEEKLLDDRRYARSVTRTQANRDKGAGFILQKLQQKGVRIELGEVQALYGETSDQDELEKARRLVERRFPRAHEDQVELRRAYSALLRRGFSGDIARKALSGKVPREAEDAETP